MIVINVNQVGRPQFIIQRTIHDSKLSALPHKFTMRYREDTTIVHDPIEEHEHRLALGYKQQEFDEDLNNVFSSDNAFKASIMKIRAYTRRSTERQKSAIQKYEIEQAAKKSAGGDDDESKAKRLYRHLEDRQHQSNHKSEALIEKATSPIYEKLIKHKNDAGDINKFHFTVTSTRYVITRIK